MLLPDALVMVVDRHAQCALGLLLPDDILVQVFLHHPGRRQGLAVRDRCGLIRVLPARIEQDIIARVHALVTDEHIVRACDQLIYLRLGPSAECAPARLPAVFFSCHSLPFPAVCTGYFPLGAIWFRG